MKPYLPAVLTAFVCLSGCGSSSSEDSQNMTPTPEPTQSTNDETEAPKVALRFPTSLMVSSPFADSAQQKQARTSPSYAPSTPLFGPTVPSYFSATEQIGQVLAGELAISDAFDVASFYQVSINSDCFGPQLMYEGHPEASGSGSSSGTLPSGDLGLWLAEDSSGNACAVSQINALLSGVESQTEMALMVIASFISVADSEGESLPEEGATLDLTTYMNAQGITSVSFDYASISLASDTWTYSAEMDYQVSGNDYRITISMSHTPSSEETEYTGLLQYTVEGKQGVSGIEWPGFNCSQNERTFAASLAYEREDDEMNLQLRNATLCGHSASGVFNSNGLVDVDNTYSASNSDGWSENFAILGADFDLTSLAGSYSYVWQAGVNDSHSRIFNIGFNDTSLDNGEAHFGYGEQVTDTDGWIQGFICNWAGPGASHALVAKTQRQFFEYDASLSVYLGTVHRANIEYAPTTSCDYDGSGSFIFDIDLSGVLGDISAEDSSSVFTNDLWSASDTSLTVPEALAARGLTVPSIPFSWPKDE
ncbi:hypothetical protein C1E24_08325 [Pseudoalteromonas phenolica]|uniref:Uncharacterized protein n=1 Tax=Pseudoalteromonas phenolica TaxID=161398 RepID=A0A5R9Q3Z0_9GAMM|nr:hypothetical protein [Pseudoalteromonas phenolica]TLX47352.1 hypothetical protein C1E24_08325 [Pseudoalteromonas phenolica]